MPAVKSDCLCEHVNARLGGTREMYIWDGTKFFFFFNTVTFTVKIKLFYAYVT